MVIPGNEFVNFLYEAIQSECITQERFRKSGTRAQNASNLRLFQQNLIQVADHNLNVQQGKHSWIKAVNQFTDMVRLLALTNYCPHGSQNVNQ